MAKRVRFWGVFCLEDDNYLASFKFEEEAIKDAREQAKQNVGKTFVVLECKEAFTSSVSVSKTYLDWPTREDDVMPERPNYNLTPLSDAAGEAAKGFVDNDF